MPHHSSEEMNLSVGIRASFTQRLFQAFWHHTRVIKRLGWFEKFFVTPSHHRVHHGVNPQYLDKNFSEFLIIWDKIFGTYAPEEEEICYGLTHPPRTWDPIYINFQYWKQLWDDAVAAPFWWDKIRLWFMPLGWRPRGLEQVDKDKRIGYSLSEQVKYKSQQFRGTKPYLISQLVLGMVVMFVTINMKFPLAALDRILLSATLFFMIINWGGLLMARSWSIPSEIIRLLVMGGTLLYVLEKNDMASWTGWPTILTGLAVGGSILYVSFIFRRGEVEGEAMISGSIFPDLPSSS
ncbi:UNVERIFIED_CONTAM: hypothetical protein GTU68_061029 [Idotea baltica]|nr:hypothetical protein [Idotea baltica]